MNYILPVTLDIYSANSTYRAKQNDAGSRYLLATINANGVLQTVPATATVSLKVVKPDDTKTLTAGTVSNGKILVELTNQTLAVSGMAYCELQIIESGSKNGIVGNMLADNSGGAITDNGTGTVKYGNVT